MIELTLKKNMKKFLLNPAAVQAVIPGDDVVSIFVYKEIFDVVESYDHVKSLLVKGKR